jgi:prevent-host-death family protein
VGGGDPRFGCEIAGGRALIPVDASIDGLAAAFERGGDLPLDDVTSHDHNQVMSKVGIADLKANLSRYLRGVRGGRTITVVDRDTPVARIVPYDVETVLEIRRATRKPGELRLPSPLARTTDSLALLLQDRTSR